MRREINLFQVALVIIIFVFTLLSFFDCIVRVESGSVDDFASKNVTDRFFDNASWIILGLSIIQIVLLKSKNKWLRIIRECLALVSALVTTAYPIYLLCLYPGYIGCAYGYVWTLIGYVVLALSWLIFMYNIILLRIVDRKTSGV